MSVDNINQSYKSFNEQSDIPTIWANAIVIDVKQGNITIDETNQSSTPDRLRYKLNDAIRTQNTNSPNLWINTLIPIVCHHKPKTPMTSIKTLATNIQTHFGILRPYAILH